MFFQCEDLRIADAAELIDASQPVTDVRMETVG